MKNHQLIHFADASAPRYAVIFFTNTVPKDLGQCVIVKGETDHHVADALTLRLGYNVNIVEIGDNEYLLNLGERTYQAYVFHGLSILGVKNKFTQN